MRYMTNFNYLAGIRPLRLGLTCCDSWHPKFDPAWNALQVGVMNSDMLSWILMTVPAYSLMSFFLVVTGILGRASHRSL